MNHEDGADYLKNAKAYLDWVGGYGTSCNLLDGLAMVAQKRAEKEAKDKADEELGRKYEAARLITDGDRDVSPRYHWNGLNDHRRTFYRNFAEEVLRGEPEVWDSIRAHPDCRYSQSFPARWYDGKRWLEYQGNRIEHREIK